jgi:hypothetical protein
MTYSLEKWASSLIILESLLLKLGLEKVRIIMRDLI